MNKEYSVLMSVYAKENPIFLRESIESLLSQTLLPTEFVLVCDGPLTDELDKVVNEVSGQHPELFRIVRLEQNMGLGLALNEGMKHCSCEVIARADSDDISTPERCEKQLKMLESNNLDILSGMLEEFERIPGDGHSRRMLPGENDEIYRYAKRRCPFNHPCVMFKKSAVLAAGGYQDFHQQEDYYLWVRMMLQGVRCGNLSDLCLYMRAGDQMYARRGGKERRKNVALLHKYMYREKFCSLFDYLFVTWSMTVVQAMPLKFKKLIYSIFLRK